jgi:ABC-type dipeptide/oligopeptide/nickel transport system ATPase component
MSMTSETSQPLLDIKHLSVEFMSAQGAVHALDDISLHIAAGESVALLGESGSGKSVLSLSIMRLLNENTARMHADQVLWRRRNQQPTDLMQLSQSEMASVRGNEIGMIFQEPMTSLNPVHTIGAQIAEVLTIHSPIKYKEALSRARDLLQRVGIAEPERRLAAYPHHLSGGMRQRVMIAMALACDPLLLIADEPTTALDVTIQAQILDLFRSMRQTAQLSMLFITHDLGVVAEVADRVYVMYAGQVVESGAIETILKSPRHPYTRGLIASVPRIDRPSEFGKKFYTIPGRAPQAWNLPKGCRFQERCEYALAGVCDEGVPPLESLTAEHAVRCFRQQELNGAASV